jgi:hypothetical protein
VDDDLDVAEWRGYGLESGSLRDVAGIMENGLDAVAEVARSSSWVMFSCYHREHVTRGTNAFLPNSHGSVSKVQTNTMDLFTTSGIAHQTPRSDSFSKLRSCNDLRLLCYVTVAPLLP